MPRQPISYTVPQPLEPLNIEEVRFWLEIMQEHAILIKAGLPCDRTDLINEANNFIREFDTLNNRVDKVQSEKKFNELVNCAYDAVCELYRFKRHLLRMKLACKLAGWTFPSMLDHMAREAEYVMRLFEKMRDGRPALKAAAKTQENAFWVRIMGNHAQFMNHLLDPSERAFVQTTGELAQEFDDLYLQSLDFVSMLHHSDNDAPAFGRFLQDVRTSTRQLRDFKRAAQDMIAQCKLVSLIPELLADHVRREAEHFLMILAMMEKGIITNVTCPEPDWNDDCCEEYIPEEECAAPKADYTPPCDVAVDYDDREEESDDEEYCDDLKKAKFEQYKSPKSVLESIDCDEDEEDEEEYCPPTTPAPKPSPKQDSPKYKWGSKWPRPLGKS